MWILNESCGYAVAYHAWNLEFFEFIISPMGVYMCSYDNM